MKHSSLSMFLSSFVASIGLLLALLALNSLPQQSSILALTPANAATTGDHTAGITLTQRTDHLVWDTKQSQATGDFTLEVLLDSTLPNGDYYVAFKYIGIDAEPQREAENTLGWEYLIPPESGSRLFSDTVTLAFTRTGETTVQASLWYSNTIDKEYQPVMDGTTMLIHTLSAVTVVPSLALDMLPADKTILVGEPLSITATIAPAIMQGNVADGLWDAILPPMLTVTSGEGTKTWTETVSGTGVVALPSFWYSTSGVYSPTVHLNDGGIYGGKMSSEKAQIADVTVVPPAIQLSLNPATTSFDGNTGPISATATVTGHNRVAVSSTVTFSAKKSDGTDAFPPVEKVLPAGETSVTAPISFTVSKTPFTYTIAADLTLLEVMTTSNKIKVAVAPDVPAKVTVTANPSSVAIVGDTTASVSITAQLWADEAGTTRWIPPDDKQHIIVQEKGCGDYSSANSNLSDATGKTWGTLSAQIAGETEIYALYGEGDQLITSESITVTFTTDAARQAANYGIYDIVKKQGEEVGPIELKPSTSVTQLAALDTQDKTIGIVTLPADMYDEDVIVRFTALDRAELQQNIEQDPVIVQGDTDKATFGTFRLEFFYAEGSVKITSESAFSNPIQLRYLFSNDYDDPYTARWNKVSEWERLADSDETILGSTVIASLKYLGDYAKLGTQTSSRWVYLPIVQR